MDSYRIYYFVITEGMLYTYLFFFVELLKLPDECGPNFVTIRNSTVAIKDDYLGNLNSCQVIGNAFQSYELSTLRNTF